jgi:DNA replication protein DnaC
MPTKIADVIAAAQARRTRPAPEPPAVALRHRLSDGTPGRADCPACHGAGYFRVDVPLGHPYYGKILECECAAALRDEREAARLQAAAALSAGDLALTWDSITDNGAVRGGLSAAKAVLGRGQGWVYLWGPPGPGKTMLLKAAVAESLRAKRPAVFVVWADLLNHLRAGYAAGDYDRRLEAWRSAAVLAVDEFGRAKESEWVKEAQVLIFNHRYEQAITGRGVTLFSSNFPPEDKIIEPWFCDRIRDGRFFVEKIDGPSMRPLMGE